MAASPGQGLQTMTEPPTFGSSLGCFCLGDSLLREVLRAIKDKLLSKLLEHFGARSIYTRTEGDTQHAWICHPIQSA